MGNELGNTASPLRLHPHPCTFTLAVSPLRLHACTCTLTSAPSPLRLHPCTLTSAPSRLHLHPHTCTCTPAPSPLCLHTCTFTPAPAPLRLHTCLPHVAPRGSRGLRGALHRCQATDCSRLSWGRGAGTLRDEACALLPGGFCPLVGMDGRTAARDRCLRADAAAETESWGHAGAERGRVGPSGAPGDRDGPEHLRPGR